MKFYKILALPVTFSLLLGGCDITTDKPPEITSEIAPLAETTVTEPIIEEEGYIRFGELRYKPEGEFEYEDNESELFHSYMIMPESGDVMTQLSFNRYSTLFNDTSEEFDGYADELPEADIEIEEREFPLNGVTAKQKTEFIANIDLNDYSAITSRITIQTDITKYSIVFVSVGLEEKLVNSELERFNKMADGMKLYPEKRVPQAFSGSLKDLTAEVKTDGYAKNIWGMQFAVPKSFIQEPGETGDTYYFLNKSGEYPDIERECTFLLKKYSHKDSPLFRNCNEALFKSLTNSDINTINSKYGFVFTENDEDEYDFHLDEYYKIDNIRRLEIDGKPAICYESPDALRKCLIICDKDYCYVLRVKDLNSIRYSEYVFGNLKFLSKTELKKDLYTDDISEYLSKKTYNEEDYVYYHDGNIAVALPKDYKTKTDGNILILSYDLFVTPSFTVAKYDGIPLEEMDNQYFERKNSTVSSGWTLAYGVKNFLRGKICGYNCVLVEYTGYNDTNIQMYIDAEELGRFQVSAICDEDVLPGAMDKIKDFFGSIKVGKDVIKPEADFSGSIEEYVTRKNYSPEEYETLYGHLKIAVPDSLTREDFDSGSCQYKTDDNNFLLFINKTANTSPLDYADNSYYYSTPPDVHIKTTVDGHKAILTIGEDFSNRYEWELLIFGVNEDNYRIEISVKKLSSEITTMVKEILGSVRIEK